MNKSTVSSGKLFNGFFAPGKTFTFDKSRLIDMRGRRVFEMTATACQTDLYPYQMPLQARSGPWVTAEGERLLMLSAYDYLGLIGDPRIDDAAIQAIRHYGTGTGGVRMLTGTIDLHHEMEADLAAFKGMPEVVTFTSGYLANLAVMSALLSPQDRVVMDAYSHRSLVDACRLAGVQVQRYQHNDMASLEHELQNGPPANRTLIVSDGVFSMDGDICPLPDLIAIKKKYSCYLLIDESHATGVLGKYGRGTDEHFGIDATEVDIWTGSLAKAIPSNGGFAAVSQEVAVFMQHAAAPFIFSAALCPSAVAATRAALSIMMQEPQRLRCQKKNADLLRQGLQDMGYDTGLSQTAIVPVVLREEAKAAILTRELRRLGLLVTPVMFPAVAQGMARLRLCATAAHSPDDIQFALAAFRHAKH